MTPEQMAKHFSMNPHEENGSFVEKHFINDSDSRASSGSILYYVEKDEKTAFHSIDCDEYWCFTNGSPLEIWMFSQGGKLEIKKIGTDNDCEPFIYIKKGTVFASKHDSSAETGTFLVCITVPRFSYQGFSLIEKEEMIKIFPESKNFFD